MQKGVFLMTRLNCNLNMHKVISTFEVGKCLHRAYTAMPFRPSQTPLVHMIKPGFTGEEIIFLYFALKHTVRNSLEAPPSFHSIPSIK